MSEDTEHLVTADIFPLHCAGALRTIGWNPGRKGHAGEMCKIYNFDNKVMFRP